MKKVLFIAVIAMCMVGCCKKADKQCCEGEKTECAAPAEEAAPAAEAEAPAAEEAPAEEAAPAVEEAPAQ